MFRYCSSNSPTLWALVGCRGAVGALGDNMAAPRVSLVLTDAGWSRGALVKVFPGGKAWDVKRENCRGDLLAPLPMGSDGNPFDGIRHGTRSTATTRVRNL